MGIKLGLPEEALNEVIKSCKGEEEQLKVILQYWQKGQGDTEDPPALRQALGGLKPQGKFSHHLH